MEVYLHTYCRRDYRHIILNKISKFRASGLWDNITTFFIPVSGMREQDKDFFDDLKLLSSKIKIFEHKDPVFNNEPDTLNYMKFRAENFEKNIPMLYMHTKGVTYEHPILRRNVDGWVRYLDLYTISKWEECINALNTHDVAGGLYVENPRHFSGNFWWVNSDYIKTLPTLDKENIKPLERGEFWICSGEKAKVYPVAYNAPVDLYQNYYCIESDFPEGF